MKKSGIWAAMIAAAMVLSAAGCGSSASQQAEPGTDAAVAATAEETAEEVTQEVTEEVTSEADTAAAAAEEGGENLISKYIGAYSDEEGKGYSMLLDWDKDNEKVYFTVGYIHGDSYTYWEAFGTMSGNVVTYEECAKYEMNPDIENPEEAIEELVYYDGTGSVEISEDKKITWKDDKENAGEGLVFVWNEELTQQTQQLKESQADDDDYIYPDAVMNWAGPYYDANDLNRSMVITTANDDSAECTVVVTETTSETLTTTWTMNGIYDEETMSIDYSDCVKKEITLDSKGNPSSEETVYENGEGRFVINDAEQTIEWSDDMEDAGKGSLFKFKFDYDNAGEDEGRTSEEAAEENL